MVANLVNNTYLFSADMEDIRITDVHEKLAFKMTVDGQEALSEVYYPDSGNAVVICDPGDIISEYFVRPELNGGDDRVALPPMEVRLELSDSESTENYTLHVFYSRYQCLLTRRRTLSSTPDIKSSISGRTALTISPFSSRPGQRYL